MEQLGVSSIGTEYNMQWTKELDKKAQWVPLNYPVLNNFKEDKQLKPEAVDKSFKDYFIKMIQTERI